MHKGTLIIQVLMCYACLFNKRGMVLIKMLYYLKDKGTFLLTKMLHLQVLLSHEMDD